MPRIDAVQSSCGFVDTDDKALSLVAVVNAHAHGPRRIEACHKKNPHMMSDVENPFVNKKILL